MGLFKIITVSVFSVKSCGVLQSLFEGVKITENQLQAAFAKNGVKLIAAKIGDPFDHNLHQVFSIDIFGCFVFLTPHYMLKGCFG